MISLNIYWYFQVQPPPWKYRGKKAKTNKQNECCEMRNEYIRSGNRAMFIDTDREGCEYVYMYAANKFNLRTGKYMSVANKF